VLKKVSPVFAVAALLLTLVAMLGAQRGRKVTGIVVDNTTNRPIASASVEYEEDGVVETTTTDQKGAFEFEFGTRGVVTVVARNYGTAHRRWPPRTGSSLRIALTAPASVHGTVADMATQRAVPAIVTIRVRHPENVVSDAAFSDDGSFAFEDLPPGPAVVVARAEGYAPYRGVIAVREKQRTNTRIRLLLEAAASGQVVNSVGEPVNAAWVYVLYGDTLEGRDEFESLVGGRLLTGSDGNFYVRSLLPDTQITLQAELEGSTSEVTTINVGPGMVQSGIVLRLQ
jgi:hypothetical protein